MVRFAGGIPLPLDLLAPHVLVGARGTVGRHLASVAGGVRRQRPVKVGGSLRGRELRPREKGSDGIGKTKRGKGTKRMVVGDGQGVPLGVRLDSASPAEVNLLEPTLATIRVPRKSRGRPKQKPLRVIADKGYDSDPLRERLWHQGIELIVPGRKDRLTYRHDGRKLRRYKKRWKIERTFAWLDAFRHLVVRYDRSLLMYRAFFHLACVILVLRRL